MKLHVSLNVDDIESAKQFYSALFNQEPSIVRDDYVKWDVDDPAVNFVIDKRCGNGGVDHLGIEVDNDDELNDIANRMRQSGQPFLDIENTTCCYANSDKAWVRGAANERWETFLTHSHDGDEYGDDRDAQLPSCC